MEAEISVTLSFDGHDAENHLIDFYDVAQAIEGFQRSLALTSHLILNGEIITQAPALKGAKILAIPATEGSWKITAIILAGIHTVSTAPRDTPLGHLVHSVYDYVVSESLGFHVDYEKSLGQLYEENKEKNIELPRVEQHQIDSLIEKCSTALTEIHRPIFKTRTASEAKIWSQVGNLERSVGGTLNFSTFEYIRESFVSEQADVVIGRVSSYNSNTFKGRIYVASEGRPIAFELAEVCRSNQIVQLVVASLSANAIKDYDSEWCLIYCKVFKSTSRSGHLKKYTVVQISRSPINT